MGYKAQNNIFANKDLTTSGTPIIKLGSARAA
jgi:hypothetical protein